MRVAAARRAAHRPRPATRKLDRVLNRLQALMLLDECTGDDIWSTEHCISRGVPGEWLDELKDCFESGFDHDRNTIYLGDRQVNQYHGIRDVDLAIKLGCWLDVDVESLSQRAISRSHLVKMIREAIEEQ